MPAASSCRRVTTPCWRPAIAAIFASTVRWRWGMTPPRWNGSQTRPLVELDHAADAVLRLHELEAAVDVVEADPVRDERVDVDVAVEVALHELRHLVAALHAAERRAAHAPAGDQVAGDDVERLALA